MSARQEKSRLVQPRAAVEIDDEIEAALRFSQEESTLPSLPMTAVFEEDATTPAAPALQPGTTMAPRPALPSGIESVRDSFVTVPPAVISVPPPSIPRAPALPSISYVAPDRTVPLAPLTPAFAVALTASRNGAGRPRTWAVLVSIVAIALPGGLLVGEAVTSRPVAAGSVHPATTAPTFAPETHAAEASPALSLSSPDVVSDSVDPPALVHPRRPTHRGNGKPAFTSVSGAAASSDNRAKQSLLPSTLAK